MKLLGSKLGAVAAALLVAAVLALIEREEPAVPARLDKPVKYTKHARCRMACRHISQAEAMEVIEHGRVNVRKSDPQGKPCPVVTKEKQLSGQKIRIVVGNCPQEWRVITAIDLERKHACNCR